MTTKLTLTIDDSVISVAKKYARSKGKSLSEIVENYLKTLTAKDNKEENISPQDFEINGVIELPEDFEDSMLGKLMDKSKTRKTVSRSSMMKKLRSK